MAEGLISIDDFKRVDLRVGRVVEAEAVPGSRKLIRLVVDLGSEKRQVLAGLAKWYKPEDFLGKTVVVVANLKPKRMAGLESQGMLLATCGEDGRPVPLGVWDPGEVKPGERVC
ncbi:MAG: methionine--tRNA ligase subunit beta [Desulfurococcales archaeon]|nr:methionine--tRNA ligase subunit beta [Desulfurococcales archaeon]